MIKKLILDILHLLQLRNKNKKYLNNSPLIRYVAKFIINECVVGDYYEFGVYKGQTLVSFYTTVQSVASRRIQTGNVIGVNKKSNQKRQEIITNMNYHAFDSFEGLPELTLNDEMSEDFCKGQYASSVEEVKNLAKKNKMPLHNIKFHKGWFNKTCNEDYAKKNNLKKASIIWLDCDLYSSAKDALNIFYSIIQDGTVIIIDDWFNYKGRQDKGVQKAFNDWRFSNKVSSKYIIHEYNRDSWSRVSFIVNTKND